MRQDAVQMYLDRKARKEERSRLKEMAKSLGYVTAAGKPKLSAMFRAWARAANSQLGYKDELFREIGPGNPNFGAPDEATQ